MRVNEQGRSMIEMLGVLAIVGVLSVGGIAGYSKAMNKFKTNKVIDQINMISTNIKTMYSSQRTYAGLNNKNAVKLGLIPSEMYNGTQASTSSITNAFNGDVGVLPALNGTLAESAYVITIKSLPKDACVAVLTTDWGSDSLAGITVDSNNSQAVSTVPTAFSTATVSTSANVYVPGATSNGLPRTPVEANTACGSLNAISWKYL